MVCKEDVVTWFKELTSHKRIDVMCTLLNMCLPFELRFLGTCLEDLGKRDFHDLRDVENRANNVSELSDLQCISDKRTQRKLALYLALLHSCNHACSNGLYKILANFDFGEINNLTNNSSDENPLDELLLLYTLALNHPAFTYEQRAMFGNILVKLQEEENKLYAARHSVGIGLVYVKNPMQACVPCPASDEQGQLGHCTGITMPPTHPAADMKGRNSLPPGLNLPPGLSLPPEHQMTATSYVHVTFPSAGPQQLPAVQWHGAPLMMTSLCSTLPTEVQAGGEVSPFPSSPLMSRQSSPSQSGSPSRAASPTRLGPPLLPASQQQQQQQPPPPQQAAPSLPQTQLQPQSQQPPPTQPQQPQPVQQSLVGSDRSQVFKGPLPVRRPERSTAAPVHRQNCVDISVSAQPQRVGLTRKNSTEPVDSLRETLGKEMPNYLQNLQNYSAEELRRMNDEELKELGLPVGAIHQLRAIVTKLNNTNGISSLEKREPVSLANRRKPENNADEVVERKTQTTAPMLQRFSRFPLEGTPMVYPPPSLLSAPAGPCFTCFVPVSSAPGRYPPQPQPYCCVGHGMRGLRIDDTVRHCSNSSSAASDSSSASHSPPDTPSMPTTPHWERGFPGKDLNVGERWSPGCEETEKDRRLTEPTEKPGGGGGGGDDPISGPPAPMQATGHTTSANTTATTTTTTTTIINNNNNASNSNNNSSSSSSSSNSNSNNRPRVPGLGRGKPTPPGLQLQRGRGPNPTTVILEGNHKTLPSCRREGPTMNGAQAPPRTTHPPPTPPHDDRKMYFVPSDMTHTYSTVNSTTQQPPPPQYSGGSCGSNPQHRPADMSGGGSSTVPYSPATAAAFLPHTHFNALRSTGSLFPSFTPSSYMRPFPFSPNGDLVYQYHGPQTPPPPPPTAFIPTPMVAAFSPVVPPPKVSCYNCGSQNHHASDCKDPTMEEMTKPGQYRIDYVPYQKPGECSSEK